jgi:hypothetical protein
MFLGSILGLSWLNQDSFEKSFQIKEEQLSNEAWRREGRETST